jgi:pimeloyl-ACP methyl ester carboxylesterase
MIKLKIIILFYIILICNCLNLDPFLFKGEQISEYFLDSYQGKTECSDAIDSCGPLGIQDTIRKFFLQSGTEKIAAIFLAKKKENYSNDTIILYFHGTGPHIDYYWPRTRLLYATGYSVFVIDYKGYGLSTGQPTEEGIYQDGMNALKYIYDSLGNPFVVVYAYSLGSMVGCEVILRNNFAKIIRFVLEAPIGTVESIVEDGCFLNIPGSYVTTYKGKNSEKIKTITTPLLWIHGTKDGTLNREIHGLPIWNNYHGEYGFYIKVDGAEHITCPQTIGYNNYIKCLKDFIIANANNNPFLIAK